MFQTEQWKSSRSSKQSKAKYKTGYRAYSGHYYEVRWPWRWIDHWKYLRGYPIDLRHAVREDLLQYRIQQLLSMPKRKRRKSGIFLCQGFPLLCKGRVLNPGEWLDDGLLVHRGLFFLDREWKPISASHHLPSNYFSPLEDDSYIWRLRSTSGSQKIEKN